MKIGGWRMAASPRRNLRCNPSVDADCSAANEASDMVNLCRAYGGRWAPQQSSTRAPAASVDATSSSPPPAAAAGWPGEEGTAR
eukprot:362938-Chlamydomonas_euryale.AAC.6